MLLRIYENLDLSYANNEFTQQFLFVLGTCIYKLVNLIFLRDSLGLVRKKNITLKMYQKY